MGSFNSIVCLDACFTQKHNKQPRDPHYDHPETSFISTEDVDHWRDHVEAVHPIQASSATNQAGNGEDKIKRGLRVPNSVLDVCRDSFTAADGERVKASTQFFDSTALTTLCIYPH